MGLIMLDRAEWERLIQVPTMRVGDYLDVYHRESGTHILIQQRTEFYQVWQVQKFNHGEAMTWTKITLEDPLRKAVREVQEQHG